MDKLAQELDEIEANLQLLPENSKYKKDLMEHLRKLRTEFEGKISSSMILQYKIAKMSGNVQLYISAATEEPLKDIEVEVPVLGSSESVAEYKIIEKEKIELSIIEQYISKIDYESETSQVRSAINLLVSKYDELKIYSQKVEQELAGAKYQLMMKYMQNGDYEHAEEYAKTFDTDMKIYIVDRFKGKMPVLVQSGRLEEAEKLNAYIYDDAMQEHDFELWKLLTKIEHPEVEINRPEVEEKKEEEEKSNLPVVSKKKSMLQRVRDRIEEKKYEKENEIKIFHVRYDPKNTETGMNLKDLEKIAKFASGSKNEGKKYKIVFEEGITSLENIPEYRDKKDSHIIEYIDSQNLVEVELPSTLEKLGNGVFKRTGLTSVDLSHTQVKSIPGECFYLCRNLNSVQLPSTLEEIGEAAFIESGIESIDLSRYPIKSLPVECFSGCKNLRSIQLPSALEEIGWAAFIESGIESIDLSQCPIKSLPVECFRGCKNLRSIQLPSTLEEIGEAAFIESGIESIDLSQYPIKSLPVECFRGCKNLRSIQLPSTLEEIGEAAFGVCRSLESIDLPSGLKELGEYAFSVQNSHLYDVGTGLKNINLSHTQVKSIPRGCFSLCKNLKSIQLPSALEEIGWAAFRESGIESIDLSQCPIKSLSADCFGGCEKLKSIHLPSALEEIGRAAFSDCGIESIDLSQCPIKSLSADCFGGCEKLKSIQIPNMLKEIGKCAFARTALESIDLSHTQIDGIPEECFVGCGNLKSVQVPNGLKNLGRRAFAQIYNYGDEVLCGLESIDLSHTQIETIPEECFVGCGNLKSVQVPNGLKKIERRAFASWERNYGKNVMCGIESIDLSHTQIDGIPEECFAECTRLKEIKLPKKLGVIGKRAFKGAGLEEVDLSDTQVRLIGEAAYSDCKKLERISLPGPMPRVGKNAFLGAPGGETWQVKRISLDDWSF